jgi:hypothetical protein
MMDGYELPQGPDDRQTGSDNIVLFLGLYLLILAFFILIVSISTTEEIKSKAVMDSLSSTFSSILPPTTELTAFSGRSGDIVAGKQFQDRIAGLFTAAVDVVKVELLQPGRRMRVLMPSEALFEENGAAVRAAQYPLLDRIVAALSRRPPGLRFEMEMIVGSDPLTGGSLPIGQTMQIARAGTFAREMRARGAPPDSVAIGLRPDEPDEVAIYFYVRSEDEQPLRFDDVVAAPSGGGETPPAAG